MANTEENDRKEDEELKKWFEHLKNQFHTRYKYLIGEWRGSVKAKSTDTGKFVSLDEVRRYMNE